MKKNLLLALMSLVFWGHAQKIKVSEIVGDWYGTTTITVCDHILCSLRSIEYKNYAAHLQVTVKDSILEVKDLTGADQTSFYGGFSFLPTKTQKIENGEIAEYPLTYSRGVLTYNMIDLGGFRFVRSKKNYNNLLLSLHSWVNHNCTALEDAVLCLESLSLVRVEQFTLRGDTLIYGGNNLSYLYDENTQCYRLEKNPAHTLEVVGDTLLVFNVNGSENHLKRAKVERVSNAYVGVHKTWISTSREKFITIKDVEKLETSLADDFQQIYVANVQKGEMKSYLIPQKREIWYSVYHEVYDQGMDAYFMLLPIQDADSIPSPLSVYSWYDPSFKQTTIYNRFRIDPASITNMVTGEVFSIVNGIDEPTVCVFEKGGFVLQNNPIAQDATLLDIDQFDYEVFDAHGVLQKTGFSLDGKIPMSEMQDGYYLLRINAQGKAASFKLMKGM